MAAFTADNYTNIAHNGAYGNKSTYNGVISLTTAMAQLDTLDLMKLPGGARIQNGFLVIATAVTTATVCVGVRYADGTSTGGTTGTAVLGTGIVLTTALTQQAFNNFVPFTNDVDTIVYATIVSPGFASGASIALHACVDYMASGTK
jgi:hypothetical protein